MLVSLLATAAFIATAASTPAPSDALDGYLAPDALSAKIAEIAAQHAALVTVIPYGRSAGGKELVALRIGRPAEAGAAPPAMIVVAGLDGTHRLGPEIAWRVVERLARDHADTLDGRTLFVVPQANPDAAARTFAAPGDPMSRTPRPIDDDRDGRADEDGPDDLDGDGVIALMRVANPAPPAVASLVVDSSEPRLLKAPDPLKGERPIYRLLVEGIDNDGDGAINEDGPGGVDLDRNFLHRWPEFEDGAGTHPLSEPEALALAQFVIGHPELAAGLTYGRHDNLIKLPRGDGNDVNPAIPLELDAADLALHTELARLYKEATGQTRSGTANVAGSFQSWLYAQRGMPSLAATVWGRPDARADATAPKPGEQPAEKPAGEPAPANEAPPPSPATGADRKSVV